MDDNEYTTNAEIDSVNFPGETVQFQQGSPLFEFLATRPYFSIVFARNFCSNI